MAENGRREKERGGRMGGGEPMTGTIQWFPGHMTRTRRKMQETMPLIDLVIELIDARIPMSSRNPELNTLTAGKPRLVLLNKAGLADEQATARWVRFLTREGVTALAVDCKSGRGLARILPAAEELLKEQRAQWNQKGMVGRPIRAMVVGIPNVGKSSFINRFSKGGKAKAEDRPGVTRGNQWFTAEGGMLLLDTPGVLWPKFESDEVGRHLAFIGAIRDRILPTEELACDLLTVLRAEYADCLKERYRLTELPEESYALLEAIGRRRGMLVSGGEVDTERAASMLLDEYRGGKLGLITLEFPSEKEADCDESRI